MAWYPGARKMELQPESDSQPSIRPTQFIMHSIAAPWTKERTFEYWRDSTNLESHFGQSYDGSIAQYIGTQTRADANYLANRRSDGTGAVSIETASNLNHTDPWTDAQVEGLIALGVWLHKQHGIPLRICRTASDPGFGYHRLHADWAVGGTNCPGDARVKQFKERIFPGIVARANGTPAPKPPAPPTVPPPPVTPPPVPEYVRPVAFRMIGV
ncbi:peptidoglycan recognition protein family protein [Streptomyces sp. NBC_01264]|uniref:peptidoglycan recognition protein family protein n=1 Tax=Streptomyces sp. NBC_01264 TaxID=2903804 RepID=UPI00225905BC|nr:N-acetylmuramoyl-L-alanine amidase [Streptomyces sp. NBC_01264]MCX4778180.1 N-acetylmuramoyl-L-alanine amidase [Streptomyces sp. NBC_01264]